MRHDALSSAIAAPLTAGPAVAASACDARSTENPQQQSRQQPRQQMESAGEMGEHMETGQTMTEQLEEVNQLMRGMPAE